MGDKQHYKTGGDKFSQKNHPAKKSVSHSFVTKRLAQGSNTAEYKTI